jgi:hypothetical protein
VANLTRTLLMRGTPLPGAPVAAGFVRGLRRCIRTDAGAARCRVGGSRRRLATRSRTR